MKVSSGSEQIAAKYYTKIRWHCSSLPAGFRSAQPYNSEECSYLNRKEGQVGVRDDLNAKGSHTVGGSHAVPPRQNAPLSTSFVSGGSGIVLIIVSLCTVFGACSCERVFMW